MNKIIRMLHFLLCQSKLAFLFGIFLQLMLFPLAVQKSFASSCTCSYENGSLMLTQMNECNDKGQREAKNGNPSRYWDCCTNSCKWDQDVITQNERYKACKNETTNTARQECINNITNDVTNADDPLGVWSGGEGWDAAFTPWTKDNFYKQPTLYIHALNLVATLALFVAKKYGFNCNDGSAVVMILASAVILAGEVGILFSMKDKLDKLPAKYEVSNDGKKKYEFIDLEKNSFNMLADEQKIRSEMELARTIVYSISTALFFAAAIMAISEIVTQLHTPCVVKKPDNAKESPEENTLQKALSGVSKAIVPPAALTGFKKVVSYLASPHLRLVFSLLLGSFGITISVHAGMAQKKSKERREEILALMDRYLSYQSGYFCNSRNDPGDPQCYCYDEFGKKAQDRMGSETCKAYWESEKHETAAKDNFDYSDSKRGDGPVGCMTESGQFDAVCKCRKYIKKDGKNTCYKSVLSKAQFDFGSAQWQQELDNTTTSLLNGDKPVTSFSPTENIRLAAKLSQKAKDMLDDYNKGQKEKNLPQLDVNDNTILKAFNDLKKTIDPAGEKALLQAVAKGEGMDSLVKAPELSDRTKKAIEEVGKKFGSDLGDSLFYGQSDSPGKSGKKSSNQALNKFFGGDQDGTRTGNVMDFPVEKNYKFKDMDIHKNPGQSIWQIISIRYQKSGYSKLFPEESN